MVLCSCNALPVAQIQFNSSLSAGRGSSVYLTVLKRSRLQHLRENRCRRLSVCGVLSLSTGTRIVLGGYLSLTANSSAPSVVSLMDVDQKFQDGSDSSGLDNCGSNEGVMEVLPASSSKSQDAQVSSNNGNGPALKPKRIPWNKGKNFVPEKNPRTPEEQMQREETRRRRIGAANKGRLPWNIGRKHPPETILRIKERTRLAMQNPTIKEKLRGFQQKLSPEVKARISKSVHEYWKQKLSEIACKNKCLAEWRKCIAEAARHGGHGEQELQWDSYEIELQQEKDEYARLKKEGRVKIDRRGTWTDEHRKKLSDAIKAKWASEEYRSRVMEAMENMYRTRASRKEPKEKKPKPVREPRPSAASSSGVRKTAASMRINEKFVSAVMANEKPYARKRRPVKINGVAHPKLKRTPRSGRTEKDDNVVANKKPPPPPLPAFVDLEASEKTEKLRQLRAGRLLVEMKRKEATQRARMLMAEAEKAANALEAVAYKDQFAMASLLETRRLLAEAARSMKAVESGQSLGATARGVTTGNKGLLRDEPIKSDQSLDTTAATGTHGDKEPLKEPSISKNGSGASEEDEEKTELIPVRRKATLPRHSPKGSPQGEVFDLTDSWTEEDSSKQKTEAPPTYGEVSSARSNEAASTSKTRKRWHCGRLVTVDEDHVTEISDER